MLASSSSSSAQYPTFLPPPPPSIHSLDHHHPSLPASLAPDQTPSPLSGPLPPITRSSAFRRLLTDPPWLLLFLAQLGLLGWGSIKLAQKRWHAQESDATEQIWPMFLAGIGVGGFLSWAFLQLLLHYTNQAIKVAVHSLCTYLAVMAVFCFWDEDYFWSIFCGCGAALQFTYAMAIADRLAFTMLITRKAVALLSIFPHLFLLSYSCVLLMAAWMVLWTLGISGVVAFQWVAVSRWWIMFVLSISLVWIGASLSNLVRVVTSSVVVLWLTHGQSIGEEAGEEEKQQQQTQREAALAALEERAWNGGVPTGGMSWRKTKLSRGMAVRPSPAATGADTSSSLPSSAHPSAGSSPSHPLPSASSPPSQPPPPRHPTWYALSWSLLSFGSICYGSLFTTTISTLRWGVRSVRARCVRNECFLLCIDMLFHAVETLTRTFNKFAYVTLGLTDKGFNRASLDAWELFQSTGVEALIAYDLFGAVEVMGIVLGALMTGTAAGVWAWFVNRDVVVMIGAISMLLGGILITIPLSLVGAVVSSIYLVYAEDPTLIGRIDPEFAAQLAEALHLRLQHRSGKAVVANLASAGLPQGVPPV